MPAICPDFEPKRIGDSARPALGILVCERTGAEPFAEADFIRRLQAEGDRLGLDVFAFAPWSADPVSRTVRGWRWNTAVGAWRSRRVPLPVLAYDRAWPSGAREWARFRTALYRLTHDVRPLRLLNGRLPDKRAVYDALRRHPDIRAHLPPTARYAGPDGLREWLDRHGGAAFLKPAAGSQGRGVLAVRRLADAVWELRGRTRRNAAFRLELADEAEALRRVDRWIAGRAYLMQPLLALVTPAGEPFDLRLLLQKNETGRWIVAGAAVRRGRSGTVTANLHGGGTAFPPMPELTGLLGTSAARDVLRETRRLAGAVVRQLEACFGRFAELGLDFGIDRTGKLWFLEANAKPGRAATRWAGHRAVALSHVRPLAYARSILLRLSREGHS
jgi:hypothetical protein